MTARLADPALDQLFRTARTHNGWSSEPLAADTLREIYELARFGPTAVNSSPARFVFVTSTEAKEALASVSSGSNRPKIMAAPATVIVAYDLDFAERLGTLFPHAPGMKAASERPGGRRDDSTPQSWSSQGAYLIVAARSLGLDCGPMSGFDNSKVDALFFAGTRIKSNFLCSLGRGDGFRAILRQASEAEFRGSLPCGLDPRGDPVAGRDRPGGGHLPGGLLRRAHPRSGDPRVGKRADDTGAPGAAGDNGR